MITSIREGDVDFPDVEVYYDALKYLGSLYQELGKGFSATMSLRIVTWFTFLPQPFVELARRKRPRSLVVIAHYLCFIKLVQDRLWWLAGIADKEIRDILDFLGEDWYPLLRVPQIALHTADKAMLAKLVLDNHSWEPESGPPRAANAAWVDDAGIALNYDGARFVRSDNGASPHLECA